MKTLFLFIICVFFLGCDSESTSDSGSGPGAGNGQKGSISGYISSYNPAGKLVPDQSGSKVSIEGTSYSAMTDESGKWTLNDIPNGTYVFSFSKDGYTHRKDYDIYIAGVKVQYWSSIRLYQVPTFVSAYMLAAGPFAQGNGTQRIDSAFVDSTGFEHTISKNVNVILENEISTFSIGLRMPPMPAGLYFLSGRILFSSNENIDIDDLTSYKYAVYGYVGNSSVSDTTLSIGVTRSSLLNAGFESGQRVFCVGYGGTTHTMDSYSNPILGRDVYTGYSPKRTEVIEFNVP